MIQFVKNAPWLRFGFPPSTRPDAGPGVCSDIVQLAADYYGGGYSVPEADQWFSKVTIAKAADNSLVSVSVMPANQLTRLISVAIVTTSIQVVDMIGCIGMRNGAGSIFVPLVPQVQLFAVGHPAGRSQAFNLQRAVVLGPEPQQLVVYFATGDNTNYDIVAYFVTAPRGVTFNP